MRTGEWGWVALPPFLLSGSINGVGVRSKFAARGGERGICKVCFSVRKYITDTYHLSEEPKEAGLTKTITAPHMSR
jgi:hypothetical protein